jgi:hypothetical protein
MYNDAPSVLNSSFTETRVIAANGKLFTQKGASALQRTRHPLVVVASGTTAMSAGSAYSRYIWVFCFHGSTQENTKQPNHKTKTKNKPRKQRTS